MVCREKEAAAAQKQFRSALGDHVTLLLLMRAFEAVPPKKRGAWCHRHFVSLKALRHAERVQTQLQARSAHSALHLASIVDDDDFGYMSPRGTVEALRHGVLEHAK